MNIFVYSDESGVRLVRAADIIANRVFHDAVSGKCENCFDNETNKLYITILP